MIDPQAVQFLELLSNPQYAFLLLALTAWSLAWKGVALWQSAKNNQRNWFIVLLIMNTFGILEIIYIFYFQRKKENIIEH